ncbi:MAG TPA: hypothetical protein VEX70_08175 [Pyrinomonadaceae bacterium]|nr:hypothetical protein [Pyrinomonadaceae bacterium]
MLYNRYHFRRGFAEFIREHINLPVVHGARRASAVLPARVSRRLFKLPGAAQSFGRARKIIAPVQGKAAKPASGWP